MTISPKKVMFAISDTGGGHRSAAVSLIQALASHNCTESTIVDVLRATDFPGLKRAPEIYDYCSKNQLWLNNLFFRNTNSVSRINALTKLVFLQSHERIKREVANTQPDAVVAIHPLVIGLLRQTRKMTGSTWPIVTVVTDLVTIHASWATPGADLYLVPTQESFNTMVDYGIPSRQIIHTGFPIHPKFLQNDLTQHQSRQALGIESNRFTVLITGGGVGSGNMLEWITSLETNCNDKQILVITGNNKKLYDELTRRKTKSDFIHVYGFVDNMETLMSASDVIVSKAGPGTIMEGVAQKRTLIITEAVGLQETGNIEYVQKNKLGHYCPTPAEACTTINQLAASVRNCNDVHDATTVITDGANRIADIILHQLDVRIPTQAS
jgi:UDP-N-acetylglucosamine:LPS N-acetylglucosamine transferase